MMDEPQFHWEELSGSEVLARLEHLQRAGLAPVSAFLDIHQWLPLAGRSGVAIDGGYALAQFRRAALGLAPPLACYNLPLDALPSNARTAHGARVLLSKLAGAGRIGDLAHGSHIAVVAEPGALDALPGIAVQPTKAWSPPVQQPRRVTAAGARIDAVVAATYQLSREEAQTAVKYGFVFRNFTPVSKRTAVVASGDTLIFRGRGKVQIVALGESARSGRCWLDFIAQPA